MFGYNDSAVNSSVTRHKKMHKRNVALYFHRANDDIEAKIIAYYFINVKINPADVLGKYWVHNSVWSTLKSRFFGNETL